MSDSPKVPDDVMADLMSRSRSDDLHEIVERAYVAGWEAGHAPQATVITLHVESSGLADAMREYIQNHRPTPRPLGPPVPPSTTPDYPGGWYDPPDDDDDESGEPQ